MKQWREAALQLFQQDINRSEKARVRESRLNTEYFKPFHDEDGVIFGDGRRGKGHGVRRLASGKARDNLSSQVSSLTQGLLESRVSRVTRPAGELHDLAEQITPGPV